MKNKIPEKIHDEYLKIIDCVKTKSRDKVAQILGDLFYDLSYEKRQNQIHLLTQEKQRSELSKLRCEVQRLKFQVEEHQRDNARLHVRIHGLEASKAETL